VGGIGPKTASGLLQKYKTFENLYKHITELPEKVSEKLATDAEQAALCKKLATIVTDAPVHLDMQQDDLRNFTQEKIIKAFDVLGFNTIKNRLGVFPKVVNQMELI
jgi:DNA polymerase-1